MSSWKDVHLGSDGYDPCQIHPLIVMHGEAAARNPSAHPVRIVGAVDAVYGSLPRPVGEGDLELSHIVERVAGGDGPWEIYAPFTEDLSRVGGRIPPGIEVNAGYPAKSGRIDVEAPDGAPYRVFPKGSQAAIAGLFIKRQCGAADTDLDVVSAA